MGTFERRHRDLRSECRLTERDGNLRIEVRVLSLESLVIGDMNDDVEVARRAAASAGLAFATVSDSGAGFDSRRDRDLQCALALDAAFAAAVLTGILNDLAGTPAVAARSTYAEEPLLIPNLSEAAARRARHRIRTGGRSRARARLTRLETRDTNRLRRTREHFLERDLEVVAKIRSTTDRRPSPRRTEDVPKDVPENVLEAGETSTREVGYAATNPGMAVPVVPSALFVSLSTAYASAASLKCSSASGLFGFLSGWNFTASRRYALLISRSVAVLATPRTS